MMDIINVKECGAAGDGVTDDTDALQRAIDRAWQSGMTSGGGGCFPGTTIRFPSGEYRITKPLKFLGPSNASIRLIGDARRATHIVGNHPGFIFDKDGEQVSITHISDMTLVNYDRNPGSGALRLNGSEKCVVENVGLNGYYGFWGEYDTYCAALYNCEITGLPDRPTGSVGALIAQGGLYQTRVVGFDIGICLHNAGSVVMGCAVETCETGLAIGYHPTNEALRSITGFSVQGFQTERCGTGIMLWGGTSGVISGVTITGTVGPGYGIASITWSDGIATVTLLGTTWPDSFAVTIESANVPGFNGNFTATATGTKTFTYLVPNDPGGTANTGFASRECQYGFVARTADSVLVSGMAVSAQAESAGIALEYFNSAIDGLTMIGCEAGSWIDPTGPNKASVRMINCKHTYPMKYADLPGQISNMKMGPTLGEPWTITDGASGGGSAAAGDVVHGHGTQKLMVACADPAKHVWKCVMVLA